MPVRRLVPEAFEKVWGSPGTEPWFANSDDGPAIGEIWYRTSDADPLLVKILLTCQNLSVQVHPGDAYARKHENSRGKTEMWHILRAEPGAQVAIGPHTAITTDELREALQGDGKEIVPLLRWVPAREGDTFVIPAGTIHAIGSGLTICEVQQNSDVTYRMHDFDRGRELHVEAALDVSRLEPAECGRTVIEQGSGGRLLAQNEYFRTERLLVKGSATCPARKNSSVYVAISGRGEFAGEPFEGGQVWSVSAGEPVVIHSPEAVFLVASEP